MLHASARYQSPHVLQVTRIKVIWRQKYDSLCFFFVRHVRLAIRGPKVILKTRGSNSKLALPSN